MIRIKKYGDSISIKGHSGYDEVGRDIVCASVSSILFTTLGAIYAFDDKAVTFVKKEKNGSIDVELAINKHDSIIDTLLQNMMNSFVSVASTYKENIKIESEE